MQLQHRCVALVLVLMLTLSRVIAQGGESSPLEPHPKHKPQRQHHPKPKHDSCGNGQYNMSAENLVSAVTLSNATLSPVDDILNDNLRIRNEHFDFQQKKMKINIVILIYMYGQNTTRYRLTEKIFIHYKNIQHYFRHYASFSFTIIGSENDLSRDLSTKYFPPDCYYEVNQSAPSPDATYVPDNTIPRKYEIIRKKVNYGMKTAYSKDKYDIILWAGSNDYISLNFFRQMIEDYNPNTMKLYGLTSYFQGKNVDFFTQYDGVNLWNRHHSSSFFHNGKQPSRMKFKYIGGILGVTRSVFDKHPILLSVWHHDEGLLEHYITTVLNKGVVDSHNLIHEFEPSECFFMNIKTMSHGGQQDVTSFKYLKAAFTVQCDFGISESQGLLSSLFWDNFDKEYRYFDEDCSSRLIGALVHEKQEKRKQMK
jgi:hypothetical protein